MNKLNKVNPGQGVSEWAKYSYNIGSGCSNDCRYCYAREISQNYGLHQCGLEWSQEVVKPYKTDIHQNSDGIVMFPSMHDISEYYLPTYIETLGNLLNAGNAVVIVTKPRLACVQAICEAFPQHRDYMLFRMTITSLNTDVSQLWEPGAPLPEERVAALRYAYDAGFQTSVSVEPMLDTVENMVTLYHTLSHYLTEDIWFGKMNDIDRRVDTSELEVVTAAQAILANQSDMNIRWLYGQLHDQPMVEWKDSIQLVLKRLQIV
jgi:DNA repair photolyase